MHLDHLPSLISALAGSAIGSFVIAVVADDLLGVALAVKTHTFDIHKLKSFVASQFGTKEALVLAGTVATAALGGLAGRGDVSQVALAAATATAAVMLADVVADCVTKVKTLAALPKPAVAVVAPPAA